MSPRYVSSVMIKDLIGFSSTFNGIYDIYSTARSTDVYSKPYYWKKSDKKTHNISQNIDLILEGVAHLE